MLAELKFETSLSALTATDLSYRSPVLIAINSLLFDAKSLHKLAIELATLAAAKSAQRLI